jgi:hypothetical protein
MESQAPARSRRITTWNVPHHVHPQNWSEPALPLHPNAPARIASIDGGIATVPCEVG